MVDLEPAILMNQIMSQSTLVPVSISMLSLIILAMMYESKYVTLNRSQFLAAISICIYLNIDFGNIIYGDVAIDAKNNLYDDGDVVNVIGHDVGKDINDSKYFDPDGNVIRERTFGIYRFTLTKILSSKISNVVNNQSPKFYSLKNL